jgi:CheY-like chemotaxis protein
MHATNGIDFLETLIQKGCRQQHIALMSGNFSEDDLARAKRLGCAIFNKPIAMAALVKWIEEIEPSIPPGRKLFNWK